MICNQCGHEIPDNTKFCPKCGNNLTGAAAAQQPIFSQQPIQFIKESKFDGTVLETFLAMLVTSIIASVTFGIATPWALCYFYKFVLSHIIIDGKRLTFDGTGGQLFGNWIKWFLLMLITLGIYGFWVYPRMFDWMAKHTHFDQH